MENIPGNEMTLDIEGTNFNPEPVTPDSTDHQAVHHQAVHHQEVHHSGVVRRSSRQRQPNVRLAEYDLSAMHWVNSVT